MTKPFDATLNRMLEVRPEDWAVHFSIVTGIPPGPSIPIDTDLATTLQADKIFRVDGSDRNFWSSSYVLCGLRHDRNRVAEIYRRLSMLLEDSTTYQEILEKGHSEGRTEGVFLGERKSLLLFGKTRFGEPSHAVLEQINAIQDVDRLDRLVVQAAKVSSWEDLILTQ